MYQAFGSGASIEVLPPPSLDHFAHFQSGWPRRETTSKLHALAATAERQLESQNAAAPLSRFPLSSSPTKRDIRQTLPADGMAMYAPAYSGRVAAGPDSGYFSDGGSTAHCNVPSHRAPQKSHPISSTVQYAPSQSPQEPVVTFVPQEESTRRGNLISPSMQIPSSICETGGSLGELAAQITCLFWFESIKTLDVAQQPLERHSPVKRLVPDAIPTTAFRKWVVTILTTTQVTRNVILLALLFVYRLKTTNPTVRGKAGSEYRLLTVALMLGNKFLDDNTYTNKTWAEVSGISVGEIHVMEVEFLSNMRYSLLATEKQWAEWQVKLKNFRQYIEQASKISTGLISPTLNGHPILLPSPPSSMQASPPALAAYPPNSAAYNYNQQWSSTYSSPSVGPLPAMPGLVPSLALQPTRKRSYDEQAEEPPAKRPTRSATSQVPGPHLTARQNAPRLPVPNLSISTGQGYPQQHLPALPPLSGRAMSSVYPSTPGWALQPQMALTPTTSSHMSNQPTSNYGTPSRRHSPHSVHDLLSMNSSPITANFASDTNSPSFFLQQRNSPYRPVRLPNTLLYPPPSASMQNYSAPSIEQMHYQPLGKRNDYRSGVLPAYSAHPHGQPWPVLPQPNFHPTT